MLFQRLNVPTAKAYFNAFTLLESLLVIALGSLILIVMMHFYSQTLITDKILNEQLRLQQISKQLNDYFGHHIQHFGYRAQEVKNSNLDLFAPNQKFYLLNKECLIFIYDANHDGCIGTAPKTKNSFCSVAEQNNSKELQDEIFGFKVSQGVLYHYALKGTEKKSLEKCNKIECAAALKSCANNWESVSDKESFNIQSLAFDWKIPEKLMQVSMTIQSSILPEIVYQSTQYIAILNAIEE